MGKTAEEAIGNSILDMLAHMGVVTGLFAVTLQDDGAYVVEMILPVSPDIFEGVSGE